MPESLNDNPEKQVSSSPFQNQGSKIFLVVALVIFLAVTTGAIFVFLKNQAYETKRTAKQTSITDNMENMGTKTSPPTLSPEKKEIVAKMKTHLVSLKNGTASPATLYIKLHDQVRWSNDDEAGNYRIKGEGWGNIPIEPGMSFVQSFKEAGTFTYTCTLHPEIQGSIIVQ